MGSVTDLLNEARNAGLTVRVDGARLVVRGPRSAEAVARRLLNRKPEVLTALASRTESDVLADEPIDWWQHISDEDWEYLQGPEVDDPPTVEQLAKLRAWQAERHPGKCFFCGGRNVHNPDCFIVTFKSVLPFGRYKGRLVSDVPTDYLIWLLENSTSLPPELRVEIEKAVRNAQSAPQVLRSMKESTLMSEPPGCENTRAAPTTTQPLRGGSRHG